MSIRNCSSDCGSGERMREVYCALDSGEELPDSYCNENRRPDERKTCQSDVPCGGKWFTGIWGDCSTECGSGIRKREVMCLKKAAGETSVVDDSECQGTERPGEEETCNKDHCQEDKQWYMSEWSACSVTCGSGHKTRQVMCMDGNKELQTDCDLTKKPSERQQCNKRECENETKPDPKCRDRYSNCQVVVQARLCWYQYYKQICCASCS